jgi:G3E family GTPase
MHMSSEMSASGGKVRLVVIGGFPGAGKTTAIAQFSKYLKKHQQNAAVITNDYGSELVDTALMRAQGIFTHALEGGDLCSRSDEALRIASRLGREQRAGVIVAEPAGICAELAQTILLPAKMGRDASFAVAPLSVLVDPIRALRVLRRESASRLAQEIFDLYRRQLAEAEIVVINKSDILSADKLAVLRDSLREIASSAKIFSVSAKAGAGLEEWFECLMTKETSVVSDGSSIRQSALTVSLAWLNCSVSVSSVRYFDSGKLLIDLATCIQSLLQAEGGEVAHLKIALHPEHDGIDLGAVSLDRNDASPELLRNVSEPIQRGELILNARAYGDPEILHSVINRALLALMEHFPELFARMHHCEHFKVGASTRPQPPSVRV